MVVITSDIIDEFNRCGFIVLRNFFTDLTSSKITETAERLYNLPEVENSYMKYYENSGEERILSRIEYFYKSDDFIRSLIDEEITPLISKLLGERSCLLKDKLNWKLPGGGAFKPHQDFEAWSDFPAKCYITCALFADFCTKENGCLEMVESAHKDGILKNTNGTINREIVDNLNWKPILVSPADLVVFDSYVPHRSEKNTSNSTRRVFYFTYNKESEGNYYEDYFKKKREELPPDFERDPKKKYNLQSKYNLANPIS